MMSVIRAALLAVSSSMAASIVVRATLAMALSLIAARMARRNRAALRHTVLSATFSVLALLPMASVIAPPVRIALVDMAPERTANTLPSAKIAIPHNALQAGGPVLPAAPGPARPSPAILLLAAWIAGATLFLLPVAIGLWQVRSLRQSAAPWPQGQSMAEKLALDAGIHRRVELLIHETLSGPMTCGILHPAIVLPQEASNWNGEDLNRALVHELEHVRRADWVSHCFARAISAMYWFHPLVWIVWRRLLLEAERSCDDAVLGNSEATAYADQLVGLAERLSVAAKSPLLAMANRADLATRVGAVLDSRQRRGRAGRLAVMLVCAAGVMLVVTTSPIRMVAAPAAASADVNLAEVPRYSGTTMLVIADVFIADQNDNNIEGLTPKDFVLSEDGMEQTISVFEFQRLVDSPKVRSYYVLGYYSSNLTLDRAYRKIQVTRRNDTTAKLDYRSGYYAFSKAPSTAAVGADNNLGPGITPPVLIAKKDAEYSEQARKAKHQGTVFLAVEVNASGQVTSANVVRSLGLGLDEKAIEAVKQWQFQPGLKDGKPIAMQAEVEITFRLL